ncbi:hypothetical protein HNP36_001457 [Chryseobacterium shigense]|uniref:Uncharacterized protein n=1 Tax=Chryseobacterium shigense TaxID=297244 RepID=A0A841N0Q2_9FLAO|nr:hypothetical protein [Chryseobacterium shigense]
MDFLLFDAGFGKEDFLAERWRMGDGSIESLF